MPRTFVLGDIHGAYRALQQCLERSAFDFKNDHLIFLGDVADGWPETRACIDELLKIEKLTFVLGNHDFWTLDWMENNTREEIWLDQGGKATIESYKDGMVPQQHLQLLKNAVPYYLKNQKLFVHAGIDPHVPLEKQTLQMLLWDRNFARLALTLYQKVSDGKITTFDEVYIGHTPVPYPKPIQSLEVWFLDTGAGWSGVLSMMNIETKEVFSSDPVPSLYPGVQGRRKK
jgi:serine/threonine protein phosphatase 1